MSGYGGMLQALSDLNKAAHDTSAAFLLLTQALRAAIPKYRPYRPEWRPYRPSLPSDGVPAQERHPNLAKP